MLSSTVALASITTELVCLGKVVVPGPHVAQARASAAAGATKYGMLLPSSDLPCWPLSLEARTLSVAI
jgi:hypothetical protein